MIRGLVFSRVLAAASSAAIAAACAMFWTLAELQSKNSEHQRRASGIEAGLSAQIAAKSEFERDRLEALRIRVGLFRVHLGTANTWDRLVKRFGAGWTIEAGPSEDRNGCSVQYGVFSLKSPELSDWPGIIEILKDSEGLPGVGIVEFEMKTSGNLERRSLDLVRIHVAVQTGRKGSDLAESK